MGFLQTIGNNLDWQIADESGNPVLPLYSILSVSVQADGQVVSDPVEMGSFTSYNKTIAPVVINLEIAFSGTNASLLGCVEKVKELQENVSTFSIVTPYYEWENMTLESFSYEIKRESGVGGMLKVALTCVEIKEVAAAYSAVSQDAIQANQAASISSADATDPSDVSPVQSGQTATATPTTAEDTAASGQKESILYQINNGWA